MTSTEEPCFVIPPKAGPIIQPGACPGDTRDILEMLVKHVQKRMSHTPQEEQTSHKKERFDEFPGDQSPGRLR
jgi:hypothetical protein